MKIQCINNYENYENYFLTIGKIYLADVDIINKPDCYWLVNDQNYYSPYKKSLFITEQEIRKLKLEKIYEQKNISIV